MSLSDILTKQDFDRAAQKLSTIHKSHDQRRASDTVAQEFAMDLVHEIRNPLASLRSAMDALDIVVNSKERQVLCRVINSDLSRLDRLVEDMAKASRLDVDLLSEEKEAFDFGAMVGRVLGRTQLQQRPGFGIHLPSSPVWISGLERRCEELVDNLLSNAASFCAPDQPLLVAVGARSGILLLLIEDHGTGVGVAQRERIFERFYSLRPEREYGLHSGLGLSICRRIAAAHLGAVWVEPRCPNPRNGTGSRFFVAIPT